MNPILTAIASRRWLITREGMNDIVATLEAAGGYLGEHVVGDLFAPRPEAAAARTPRPRSGSVGVVGVRGPIVRYDSWFTMYFGGTSVEWMSQQIRELASDESVGAILLDIDSPGGTIDGLPELAATLRAARTAKPMVALSNPVNASAAYWIAAQADEVVSTPEGLTGSVGVFTEHWDYSAMLADAGIGHEFIQAGRFKTEGNPYEPLGDDARTHVQSIIDDGYALFLADVAKGRGITAAAVKADYGEGRIFPAKDAKAKGLVDRVGSYADALGRAGSGKVTRRALVEEPATPIAEVPAPDDRFAFERERRERQGLRIVTP